MCDDNNWTEDTITCPHCAAKHDDVPSDVKENERWICNTCEKTFRVYGIETVRFFNTRKEIDVLREELSFAERKARYNSGSDYHAQRAVKLKEHIELLEEDEEYLKTKQG